MNLDGVNDNENIYNWNMLGKRGNIVQTYPAVEYDFTPRNLQIKKNDLIHIQWTGRILNLSIGNIKIFNLGSNTHNNQGNSDGQAGDDGQGKTGIDQTSREKTFMIMLLSRN